MTYPEAEMAKEKVTFFFHRHRSTGKRPPQREYKARYHRPSTPIVPTSVSSGRRITASSKPSWLQWDFVTKTKAHNVGNTPNEPDYVKAHGICLLQSNWTHLFILTKWIRVFDSVSFYAVNHQLFVANVFKGGRVFLGHIANRRKRSLSLFQQSAVWTWGR